MDVPSTSHSSIQGFEEINVDQEVYAETAVELENDEQPLIHEYEAGDHERQSKIWEQKFKVALIVFFMIECARLMLSIWVILGLEINIPWLLNHGFLALLACSIGVILLTLSLTDCPCRGIILIFYVFYNLIAPLVFDAVSIRQIVESIYKNFFHDARDRGDIFLGILLYAVLLIRFVYFTVASCIIIVYQIYHIVLWKRRRTSFSL